MIEGLGGRGKEWRHGDDYGVSWFGSAKVGTVTTIYVKSTHTVINMKLNRIRFKCRWDGKLKDKHFKNVFSFLTIGQNDSHERNSRCFQRLNISPAWLFDPEIWRSFFFLYHYHEFCLMKPCNGKKPGHSTSLIRATQTTDLHDLHVQSFPSRSSQWKNSWVSNRKP